MTTIKVGATPTGWHIEADAFLADLNACRCDASKKTYKATAPCRDGYHRCHVETFVKRLAATFGRSTTVPVVPPLGP